MPAAFKPPKETGFGMFGSIAGWIQPLPGICSQKSSPEAVCLVVPLAGGSIPSAQVRWWSWISMVISLLFLKGFSHLEEEQSWDRRCLAHLTCFTFDLAVILLSCLKGQWCHKLDMHCRYKSLAVGK